MKLTLPIVSTVSFTVNSERKLLVGEMSAFRGINMMSLIYDDACDAGFIARSHKTGQQVTWAYSRDVRSNDADAELQATVYIPVDQPALIGWELHLLNT